MATEQAGKALHFSIDGALIADVARERFVDKDPEYAYNLLKDGLDGISHEEVLSILSGQKTLVGINEIEIVDFDDKEYQDRIKKLTTGIYRHKGKLYQPISYVAAFDAEDYTYASAKSRDHKSEAFTKARNEYYCEDDEICVRVEEFDTPYSPRHYVLFKQVSLIPGMAKSTNNAEVALQDYLKHYELRIRNSDSYTFNPDIEEKSLASVGVTSGVLDALAGVPEEKKQTQKEEIQSLEEQYAREDAEFAQKIEGYRTKILEQVKANGDKWMELRSRDGELLATVAEAPFIHWCVDKNMRSDKKDLLPAWDYVSSSGLKMRNDDPVHTDWMLSANLSLDDWYDDEKLKEAAYHNMHLVQDKLFNFKSLVLSTGHGYVTGTAVLVDDVNQDVNNGDIVVLKNATPQFEKQMLKATKNGKGGVIVSVGSSVAHLAKIGRESGVVMMRMENAFDVLNDGDTVSLNSKTGEIKILGQNFEQQLRIEKQKEKSKDKAKEKSKNKLKL
jgi:phosphohistidine swiveling domain-containing protein